MDVAKCDDGADGDGDGDDDDDDDGDDDELITNINIDDGWKIRVSKGSE